MSKARAITKPLKEAVEKAARRMEGDSGLAGVPLKHKQKLDSDLQRRTETDTDLARDAQDGAEKPKPYANPDSRPKYGKTQVQDVWNNSLADQQRQITEGKLDLAALGLDPPGPNQMWVESIPDGTYRLITWQPGQPRRNVWDMGHRTGHEYRDLHAQYMAGDLSKDEFLAIYRDPANYEVQDWLRNQSHVDEA